MFNQLSRAAMAVALFASLEGQAVADPAAAPTATDQSAEVPLTEIVSARLPVMTVVELRVVEEVSSKTALTGMPVRLELAEPLYFGPDFGLPAGTPVDGIVIHAARGGMGGKSGELLLGARKISLGSQVEVPLRSFRLGPAKGQNNETLAFATAVTVGLPALLISGGSAKVPAGSIANAKTRADVEIPVTLLSKLPPIAAAAPTPAPPAPATQPVSTQGESE